MLREVLIDFMIKCMIMNMKLIFIILLLTPLFAFAEVNSWECNKFEGAEIIAEDGTELGKLGPQWETDSIFLLRRRFDRSHDSNDESGRNSWAC